MNTRLLYPFALLALAALSACGGGGTVTHIDPTIDLLGTWRGTYTLTRGSDIVGTGTAVTVVAITDGALSYDTLLTPAGAGDTLRILLPSRGDTYFYWINGTGHNALKEGSNGCQAVIRGTPGQPPRLEITMKRNGGFEQYRTATHKD